MGGYDEFWQEELDARGGKPARVGPQRAWVFSLFTNASLRFGGMWRSTTSLFEAEEGSIFGLIGPNGAGKTTAFNAITPTSTASTR